MRTSVSSLNTLGINSLLTRFISNWINCADVHAVGIDLHQKVILMKESSSSVVHKHETKHVSSFAHPKDLYAIDDADKCTLTSPAERKKASRADTDYMSVSILIGF